MVLNKFSLKTKACNIDVSKFRVLGKRFFITLFHNPKAR